MKKFFWMMIAGALFGALLAAWFSPGFIIWYSSPPADLSISCKPAIEWGIHTYRKFLFTGVLLGAITSGILFFALRRSTPAAQAVPSSAPNDQI